MKWRFEVCGSSLVSNNGVLASFSEKIEYGGSKAVKMVKISPSVLLYRLVPIRIT